MSIPLLTPFANASSKMDWWRDTKLGLFIHWGPYTRLHGRWQGKPLSWCAEWAHHLARIPDQDYRQLGMD